MASRSAHVVVSGCEIEDAGLSGDGSETSGGAVHGLTVRAPSCQVLGNRVSHADGLNPEHAHSILLVSGVTGNLRAGSATITYNSLAVF